MLNIKQTKEKFLIKLKEAFALAKTITEERADSESIDKYISMFNKGIEIINSALKNGKNIEHNDNNLTLALDNISKEITREYFVKEKAHRNTSIIKQKYEELLKEITKYNRILNLYKRLRKTNEKTAGDSFRNLGGNTERNK